MPYVLQTRGYNVFFLKIEVEPVHYMKSRENSQNLKFLP